MFIDHYSGANESIGLRESVKVQKTKLQPNRQKTNALTTT